MGELKPCPYCGERAEAQEVRWPNESPEWYAQCPGGCMTVKSSETRGEAVGRWNEAADVIGAHRRKGGGCPYCRGEKPLLDDLGKDGGWIAGIHPGDGTMTARFDAGAEYGHACGELLLDIEHCPKCGAGMAGVAAKLEAELARAKAKLSAIEEKVVEIEDAQFGGYVGEGDLVDELDWLSGEIDSLRAHVEGGL